MKLEELVAVSGMAGVFKLAANRNNGLIIEDLGSGKKRFASARKHQFTPLASIAIFTLEDSTELKVVFRSMLEQIESNPIPATKASSADLHAYFKKILPDYDEDKVHTSDIKKLIKWFNFLNEKQLIDMIDEDEPEEEKTEEKEEVKAEEKKEKKPKKATSKKAKKPEVEKAGKKK